MRRPLPVLLVLALLLAGCAGGSSSTDPSASDSTPAPPEYDVGRIRGVVTDDSGLPIEAVTVALADVPQQPDLETTTDQAGAFGFDGLPPGTFRLLAQKLGYESVGRKVDVVGGADTPVEIQLAAIQAVDEYHTTRIISGLMGCVITVLVPLDPGYTSYGCGDTAQNTNANPNNKIMLNWTIAPKAVTHIAEMYWEPQSSMSDQLRFQIAASLDCSGPVCAVGSNYATKGGPPPVVHRYDETGIRGFGKSPQNVVGRFTGGPVQQTMPVRVIVDQKFDVYLTDFFGAEPPEEWTATPPKA